MKIAITGSTWFIGGHLVRYFDNGMNTIYAFGRSAPQFASGNIIPIIWDMNDPIWIHLDDIDLYIHVASDTNYRGSIIDMQYSNVDSLENILGSLTKNIKHFIYISSSSIYQWVWWIPLREDMKIDIWNLHNSYARTKYLAEQKLMKEFPKNIKLTIIRPRAVYGIWDKFLLPTILQYTIFGRLLLFWDGSIYTSLTSVENLCEAVDTILDKQHTRQAIYNIADREPLMLEQIYQSISRQFGLMGVLHIPYFFIHILMFFDKNRFSYVLDSFQYNKILDLSKIEHLWYRWKHTFLSFMDM